MNLFGNRRCLVCNRDISPNEDAMLRAMQPIPNTHTITYGQYDGWVCANCALISSTIMGRSIQEVTQILAGLEIERATGISVTMENLSELTKRFIKEMKEANEQSIKNMINGMEKSQ